jgi:hypothetical protein
METDIDLKLDELWLLEDWKRKFSKERQMLPNNWEEKYCNSSAVLRTEGETEEQVASLKDRQMLLTMRGPSFWR